MPNGYSVGNLEMSIQTVGNGAVTSLTLTNAQLKQMLRLVSGNNSQLGKMGGNVQKTFSFAKALGKIYFIRNYTKQLANTMVGLVQNAINYTETLNLWQVAMRGNISTAEEFISKMNKAYGIAEETLMRYQATFRNMLATLGGVSTDVSYALSEYLTQMALDYASLYNTSIEKAMTVFQSVLSGQVRPIRSISGYDITETTIFELYQQLGGTKTMRQLTQTEKRLLRIYAVFQQMDRSGAIGDLNKTLNNTANQMRVMSESAKELGMWIGKLIELYIAPALPYINAFLITAKNIAQAIVKSLPEYSEFDGTIKGYEETAEAMDEVQGKLLDFDKFRSLSGNEENSLGLGIDEKLIDGLTQYQSILENVSNKATELAEKWTKWWIDDETGELTENAQDLLDTLKTIGTVLGIILGLGILKKVGKLGLSILGLRNNFNLLNITLKAGLIASIYGLIKAFQEDNDTMKVVYGIITGLLIGAYILLAIHKRKDALLTLQIAQAQIQQANATKQLLIQQNLLLESIVRHIGASGTYNGMLDNLNIKTNANTVAVKKQATAWGIASKGISAFSSTLMIGLGILSFVPEESQNTVSAIMAIVGGLTMVLGVLLAIKSATRSVGIITALAGLGAVTAGVVGFTGALKSTAMDISATDLQVRRSGGMVEDGLFTMNKGEVMGTFDDGTSIVANNQQIISGIKQGVYQAVSSALQANGSTDNRPIDIYIDGERLFQATKKNAKRHGLAFSKV